MHKIALHWLRVNRACRVWQPFLCAWILAIALRSGDWNLPDNGLAEIEIEISEFLRYNDVVCRIDRAMLNNRILAESDCEWPLLALGADDNPFPSSFAMGIASKTGGIVLAADGAGRISFPVRADLRRENPPVDFPDSGFGRPGIQRLIVGNPRLSRLTIQGAFAGAIFRPWKNAVLEGDGFAVYYPKEMLASAKQSLQELQKQRNFLAECFGMEPAQFGVNLVACDSWPSLFSLSASANLPGWNQSPGLRRENPFAGLGVLNQVTIQADPARAVFSWSPGWHDNDLVQWINLHEWAELSLVQEELRLHRSDAKGRNRFFADGLAEYTAFHYLNGRTAFSGKDNLERLLRYGIRHIDFTWHFRTTNWENIRADRKNRLPRQSLARRKTPLPTARLFQDIQQAGYEEMLQHGFFKESILGSVRTAGYAVAFHFWEQLARQHGRDLPKRFLQSLAKADPQNRRFEDCLALLEQLTGETLLRNRIAAADLSQTLAFLTTLPEKPLDRKQPQNP